MWINTSGGSYSIMVPNAAGEHGPQVATLTPVEEKWRLACAGLGITTTIDIVTDADAIKAAQESATIVLLTKLRSLGRHDDADELRDRVPKTDALLTHKQPLADEGAV